MGVSDIWRPRLGCADLIDDRCWGQSQDMTRIHCGPHYYNIYYIRILSDRTTSVKHAAGKEKRQGDTMVRCNNPATLFDATVRECGQ